MNQKTPALWLCIVMDLLGYATYALPLIGEIGDVVWAPISAMVFYNIFGGKKAIFGSAFAFLEELIPGMDFIPTFTIAYFWQKYAQKKQTANVINIKPA